MSDVIERLFREDLDRARDEGIEIGREKGIEIGREKGIEIGREKGIIEGIEIGALETARNLLGIKMPHEQIAQVTGLTLSKIKTLMTTS